MTVPTLIAVVVSAWAFVATVLAIVNAQELRETKEAKHNVVRDWTESSDRRSDAKSEFFEELERITEKYRSKC